MDRLARSLAGTGLPHPLLVDAARAAIAADDPGSAEERARGIQRRLLMPVINGTGVLLHTNLGRAPVAWRQSADYSNLELDLATGERGDRQAGAPALLAQACGAEAALVVNNCAAAVMLVLASLAEGRDAVVSRGELVEIGGGFRVPDVMAWSAARLVEVGTTNRTRRADYAAAVNDPANECGGGGAGPPVELPDGGLHRGTPHGRAGRPGSAAGGRHRLGPARQPLRMAVRRSAAVAGTRASRPPDPRRWRRLGDVLRRQAAGRTSGRCHRRTGRPGRCLPPTPAGPGPAAGLAGAGRTAGHRAGLPARRRRRHRLLAHGRAHPRRPTRSARTPTTA